MIWEEEGRMEDSRIIELYWKRDESAIAETRVKYHRYLFSIAKNILFNREDSEECVSDTYVKAWNSIPPERPSPLSAWLGALTRNGAIDMYRKYASQKRIPSEYMTSLSELEEVVSKKNNPVQENVDYNRLTEAINDFLGTLDAKARNLFVGRYFYADSIEKLCGYYGMRENAVKSSLFRSRKKLKKYLIREGWDL